MSFALLNAAAGAYVLGANVVIMRMARSSPLEHSLHRDGEDEVCFFVKDPQRLMKDYLEDHGNGGVTRVMGVEKVRKRYGTHESRRELLRMYDLFLVDNRVAPMMPSLLGNSFLTSKKMPLPVDMRKNVVEAIKRAISSTAFTPRQGSSTSLRVGRGDFTAQQLIDNIQTTVSGVVKRMKKGWGNIQSLSIKTNGSPALPIYMALPTASNSYAKPAMLEKVGVESKIKKRRRKKKTKTKKLSNAPAIEPAEGGNRKEKPRDEKKGPVSEGLRDGERIGCEKEQNTVRTEEDHAHEVVKENKKVNGDKNVARADVGSGNAKATESQGGDVAAVEDPISLDDDDLSAHDDEDIVAAVLVKRKRKTERGTERDEPVPSDRAAKEGPRDDGEVINLDDDDDDDDKSVIDVDVEVETGLIRHKRKSRGAARATRSALAKMFEEAEGSGDEEGVEESEDEDDGDGGFIVRSSEEEDVGDRREVVDDGVEDQQKEKVKNTGNDELKGDRKDELNGSGKGDRKGSAEGNEKNSERDGGNDEGKDGGAAVEGGGRLQKAKDTISDRGEDESLDSRARAQDDVAMSIASDATADTRDMELGLMTPTRRSSRVPKKRKTFAEEQADSESLLYARTPRRSTKKGKAASEASSARGKKGTAGTPAAKNEEVRGTDKTGTSSLKARPASAATVNTGVGKAAKGGATKTTSQGSEAVGGAELRRSSRKRAGTGGEDKDVGQGDEMPATNVDTPRAPRALRKTRSTTK